MTAERIMRQALLCATNQSFLKRQEIRQKDGGKKFLHTFFCLHLFASLSSFSLSLPVRFQFVEQEKLLMARLSDQCYWAIGKKGE